MPPSTPRTLAAALLHAVLTERQPLEQALAAAAPRLDALAPRDRAFTRLLAATCLRRLGQIDAVLAHCLAAPLPDLDPAAHDVLRLGAAQLLFLDTPSHAAVDSAVAQIGATRVHRLKGLVNAVLRRIAREGHGLVAAQDAARLNTPAWLWQSWVDGYGAATAAAIAAQHMAEPPLDLTPRADAATWAARLGGRLLATGSIRLDAAGAVAALPGYDAGAWWVQDAAAALPARLLGATEGAAVADLCAAPGGKTAQLAAAGARVTAVDRSGRRLRRVAENLARLGLTAELVEADGASWTPERPFDAVLVDAPCTGTGIIRRHPDIPHLKSPDDVAALAAQQERLLDAALRLVRPGGTVVYCTCSLEAAEGPAQIERRLAAGGAVLDPITAGELLPAGAESPDPTVAALVTPAGMLRTTPATWADRGGLDGFFAARLRRVD